MDVIAVYTRPARYVENGVMVTRPALSDFGFALFYLRGVAPKEIKTTQIYQGVMPFIAIQLIVLAMIAYWPMLATWLPAQIS